jgi:VCBS repeat-containing protein
VDSGSVTEDTGIAGGLIGATGSLTVSDVDVGETSFQAQTVNGSYGDLVIDAAGNWIYSANNSQAAIQQLDSGEALLDTLTIRSLDGTTHDVTITINGAEDSPAVGNAIPNQTAFQGVAFNFSFAPDSFSDADTADTLTYTATLSDNSPLPAWLNFDATTRSFSGVPAGTDLGAIDIRITADDGSGSTSQVFTLNVNNYIPIPDTDISEPEETPSEDIPTVIVEPQASPGGEYVDVLREYDPTPYVRVAQTPETETETETIEDIATVTESEQDAATVAELVQDAATAAESAQDAPAVTEPAESIAAQSEQTRIENLDSGINDDEESDTRSQELLFAQMDDMRASIENDDAYLDAHDLKVGIFLGLTTTLTAGIVTWVLKSGALLASLMGAIPVLGRFDLLPILKARDDEEEVEEDDDTDLTDPDVKNQRRVENMFSDHQSSQQRSELKHE